MLLIKHFNRLIYTAYPV